MDWKVFWDVVSALVPPALMGVVVYVLMRSIFRADSNERRAYAKIEAEMRQAKAEKASKNSRK
jgi:Na+/H+ antiporter NhaD/arsenite permease-like protein